MYATNETVSRALRTLVDGKLIEDNGFIPVSLYTVKALLKGSFHPAFLARVTSSLAFVVAIFMGHDNGDNKGLPRDDMGKECWMKETLREASAPGRLIKF